MKRSWTEEELVERWTIFPDELALVVAKAGHTRLGFAVLLRFFAEEGRFPRDKGEVPTGVLLALSLEPYGAPGRHLDEPAETGGPLPAHGTRRAGQTMPGAGPGSPRGHLRGNAPGHGDRAGEPAPPRRLAASRETSLSLRLY